MDCVLAVWQGSSSARLELGIPLGKQKVLFEIAKRKKHGLQPKKKNKNGLQKTLQKTHFGNESQSFNF